MTTEHDALELIEELRQRLARDDRDTRAREALLELVGAQVPYDDIRRLAANLEATAYELPRRQLVPDVGGRPASIPPLLHRPLRLRPIRGADLPAISRGRHREVRLCGVAGAGSGNGRRNRREAAALRRRVRRLRRTSAICHLRRPAAGSQEDAEHTDRKVVSG